MTTRRAHFLRFDWHIDTWDCPKQIAVEGLVHFLYRTNVQNVLRNYQSYN
jgi:hypothetical protein